MVKKLRDEAGVQPLNCSSFIAFYGKLQPLNQEAREAREEAKSKTGAYRAARKLGKDHHGISLRALALIDEFKAMEEEEVLFVLKEFARYARWLQLPFGAQLSMFGHNDDAPPTQDDEDEAIRIHQTETGRLRGLAGDEAQDNPFSNEPGSVAYVAWEAGRKQGAASKAVMEGRTSTVKASTGRRRKSGNPEDAAAL